MLGLGREPQLIVLSEMSAFKVVILSMITYDIEPKFVEKLTRKFSNSVIYQRHIRFSNDRQSSGYLLLYPQNPASRRKPIRSVEDDMLVLSGP